MEFNISDLLDDYQDSKVELQIRNVASTGRIKELTMKKIRQEHKKSPGGLRSAGRVVLVAAIVMALATTVLAATGFNISGWINLFSGYGYDTDVVLGSGSMIWELGNSTLRFHAEDVSASGLKLYCDPQDWNGEGALTVGAEYWLEEWDGSSYVPMEPEMKPAWEKEDTAILPGEIASWDIGWGDIYGQLPSGYYRIGRTVTLCSGSDKIQELVCYAKFRILVEEMEPYIRKCQTALEALLTADSYHLTETSYPAGDNGYSFFTQEAWKYGEDYLGDQKYMDDTDGTARMVGRSTYLLRGGIGYDLEPTGEETVTEITAWKRVDYLDENNFHLWDAIVKVREVSVGEIYADGNEIVILEKTGMESDRYAELKYTFDEQGNLQSVVYSYLPEKDCAEEEKQVSHILQVHDTPSEEIQKTIAGMDVGKPASFSWTEDQALYPDAQREGFVNTRTRTISSWEDAVDIAAADCTLTQDITMACEDRYYNIVTVFFDEEAKMWKVVFSDSQDDYYQAVYLNEQGITQMVVKAKSSN